MNLASIPRDPDFVRRLESAARRGPSVHERLAQKVSFIASALSDETTQVTEDQVRRELAKLHGDAQ